MRHTVKCPICRIPCARALVSDSDSQDDPYAMLEEHAILRLKSKNVKREHINGMLQGYGVQASDWTLSDAKEELIVQIMQETDSESSDDE